MIKAILKYIGQLKTVEERLIVAMLFSALVYIFSLWVSDSRSTKTEDRQSIQTLQYKLDSTTRQARKDKDDYEDNKFKTEIDRRIELQKYVHYQDSILDQLRKIK